MGWRLLWCLALSSLCWKTPITRCANECCEIPGHGCVVHTRDARNGHRWQCKVDCCVCWGSNRGFYYGGQVLVECGTSLQEPSGFASCSERALGRGVC
uniref:RxLR effector candidate protein n=1 Tax=Hyaloperonospora arabidopsidis (strain Emoy2) TaxID=559515 RepID=M4B1F9_HYAAE